MLGCVEELLILQYTRDPHPSFHFLSVLLFGVFPSSLLVKYNNLNWNTQMCVASDKLTNEAVVQKLAGDYRGHIKSALGANETANQRTAVECIHCESSVKAAPTHFAALHWFQSMGELYDPLQPLHELLCEQEHRGVSRVSE